MKKRVFTIAAMLAMTIGPAGTSFAGSWQENEYGRWYQNEDGSYPAGQWNEIDWQWYYFDNNGYMVHDRWIGNYYLGFDGAMLTDATTPDGYRVGADGAWIPDSVRPADPNDRKYSAYVYAREMFSQESSWITPQALRNSLTYQGFSSEETDYAMDASSIDWTLQCVKRIQAYRATSWTDEVMKPYLKEDGFTDAQIDAAFAELG
ncbi:MAG: hypothetical protein LIV11_08455 [Bacillota bacterium]|nr:hypothetical protein [Bacillota bacterium]